MHWLLFFMLSITAVFILYQDLKTRSVVWFLFPAIAVIGIINAWYQLRSWQLIFTYSGINAAFLLAQFLLLQLYFILTRKKIISLINKQLGLGDILFLVACCCCFSPANFLLFYCFGLLFALLAHLAVKALSNPAYYHSTIPLAGYQAVFLSLFTGTCTVWQTTITNDDWLLKYLLPT